MTALWKELASLGLLGADRAIPGPELAQQLAGLGLDMDTDLGELLLNGAAMVRLPFRVRAGVAPFEGILPEPVTPAPDETTCTPRSARHLSEILAGIYPLALEEFTTSMAARKIIFPAEQLPGLFDQCLRNPELWPEIKRGIGSKGRWLLKQNPEWAALADEPDPQYWPAASKRERLTILIHLRQHRPQAALSLIMSTWPDDPPADRAAYLTTLMENAGPEDESFLVASLKDRRKEVRLAAAEVLALIPGSEIANQLFSWAGACLSWQKDRVELRLPAEIPADSADFGILPDAKGGGMKIAWLRQLLAGIPPGKWEIHFGQEANQVLAGFMLLKNSDTLLAGLAAATIRFKDKKWAECLVDIRSEDIWSGNTGKKLAKLLPGPVFNKKVSEALRKGPLLEENQPLTWVLCLGEHTWEKQVTLAVIRQFQEHLGTTKTYNWGSWHYRRVLEVAGYRSDTGLADDLRRNWPLHSPLWNRWEAEVEKMLQTLHFRNRMIAAINEMK